MITEFADITGYYDDSRVQSDRLHPISLGDLLDALEAPPVRWPVRNREPRESISSYKRAIIHERDGGICRYCGTPDERLVLDHIVPRSAFPKHQIHIADRSDNLHSACWDCNERRSNYEAIHIKRLAGWRHGVFYDGPYWAVYGSGGGKGSVAQWQDAMDMHWTSNRKSIAESIPKAYTRFIGGQIMQRLESEAAIRELAA